MISIGSTLQKISVWTSLILFHWAGEKIRLLTICILHIFSTLMVCYYPETCFHQHWKKTTTTGTISSTSKKKKVFNNFQRWSTFFSFLFLQCSRIPLHHACSSKTRKPEAASQPHKPQISPQLLHHPVVKSNTSSFSHEFRISASLSLPPPLHHTPPFCHTCPREAIKPASPSRYKI